LTVSSNFPSHLNFGSQSNPDFPCMRSSRSENKTHQSIILDVLFAFFFVGTLKGDVSGRVNYSHVVLSRREIRTKFCISRNRSGMAKFCTTKTIFCWTFHSTEIKYGMETRIMHQKRERWVKKFGSPG
jgi:hypothetical protein